MLFCFLEVSRGGRSLLKIEWRLESYSDVTIKSMFLECSSEHVSGVCALAKDCRSFMNVSSIFYICNKLR